MWRCSLNDKFRLSLSQNCLLEGVLNQRLVTSTLLLLIIIFLPVILRLMMNILRLTIFNKVSIYILKYEIVFVENVDV